QHDGARDAAAEHEGTDDGRGDDEGRLRALPGGGCGGRGCCGGVAEGRGGGSGGRGGGRVPEGGCGRGGGRDGRRYRSGGAARRDGGAPPLVAVLLDPVEKLRVRVRVGGDLGAELGRGGRDLGEPRRGGGRILGFSQQSGVGHPGTPFGSGRVRVGVVTKNAVVSPRSAATSFGKVPRPAEADQPPRLRGRSG